MLSEFMSATINWILKIGSNTETSICVSEISDDACTVLEL